MGSRGKGDVYNRLLPSPHALGGAGAGGTTAATGAHYHFHAVSGNAEALKPRPSDPKPVRQRRRPATNDGVLRGLALELSLQQRHCVAVDREPPASVVAKQVCTRVCFAAAPFGAGR